MMWLCLHVWLAKTPDSSPDSTFVLPYYFHLVDTFPIQASTPAPLYLDLKSPKRVSNLLAFCPPKTDKSYRTIIFLFSKTVGPTIPM